MRNTLFAASLVLSSTLLCGAARADDDVAPVVQQQPEEEAPKSGLVVTGAVLSAFGLGRLALGGLAFHDAQTCGGFCLRDLDNWVGGVSTAIGVALLGAGIPLMVIGATAKRPRAQVAVSPTGLFVSGTF